MQYYTQETVREDDCDFVQEIAEYDAITYDYLYNYYMGIEV